MLMAAALCGCSESEYDIDNLIPERYDKVVYVKEDGMINEQLYATGGDTFSYTVTVIKTGAKPNSVAHATVRAMTQAELDDKFSVPDMKNYKRIPNETFKMDSANLDFGATDVYKNVTVTVLPEDIQNLQQDDPDAIWVLPLTLESQTDSVNSIKNYVVLNFQKVLDPRVGFTTTGVNTVFEGNPDNTLEIPIELDVKNQWNFDAQIEVDNDYVNTYNAENGTDYKPFPADCINLEEGGLVHFVDGQQGVLRVTPLLSKLPRVIDENYMLALKLKGVTMFRTSENDHYVLCTTQRIDRSNWGINPTTEEPTGEGAGQGLAIYAFDGDLSTYWHCQTRPSKKPLPQHVDIDMKQEYTVFRMSMCHRSGTRDPKDGNIYASDDGVNYRFVKSWHMEKDPEGDVQQEQYCVFDEPIKTRYLRLEVTDTYRSGNAAFAFAEIYAYGF